MNPADPSKKKQIITAVSVLVAITLIVVATFAASKTKADTTASTVSSDSATSQDSSGDANATSDTTANSGTYNDGTYSANASYQSPGGTELVSVKVTISNGVVTDSTVTSTPTEREAQEYQDKFLSGYKSQVVGKSIDSVHLSRVSGSSLTSQGFNSALSKIKQQAQS